MIIIGIILAYLIGSIPTAYVLAKGLLGVDIRQHGSGNVGATNVFRVLGKGPGCLVLLIDILKGIVAVSILPDLMGLTHMVHLVLLAMAVVCGHNWTIFLQFKGGKGVATTLGVLIGLTVKMAVIRPVVVCVILIWVASFLVTRMVSVASMAAATSLPIVMVLTNQEFVLICLGVLFCLFVVLRHKANIQRVFAGQEPRVPLSFWKKN